MTMRVYLARAIILSSSTVFCAAVRTDAASPIVTGTDTGPAAHVRAFDGVTLGLQASFLPYDAFSGGVRVAAGDLNGDGRADIVTGAGPGGAAHVKVFDGQSLGQFHSFFAFDGFNGGIYVAAGDLTGDGRADIIAGAGTGSSHVKVFNGHSQALERSFFAFAGSTLGVRVAAGDVNGDGRADVIAGTGVGAGQLKVFDAITSAEVANFSPFGPGFTGGIYVAAGDVTGDGRADLITATNESGVNAGLVRVFDGVSLAQIRSFIPFDGFTGGVRVGAGDVNGDGIADIITGTGPGAGHVRAFDGVTSAVLHSFFPYDGFSGGVFVAGETVVPEPSLLGTSILLIGISLTNRRRHAQR